MAAVAVIDFETTGLSPDWGDRATEVAAVLVKDGTIVGRYESLMNAGVRVPPFIEALTGITNAMVRSAPPVAEVMRELAEFVGDSPLVAHNASFDRKFLDAEWARINYQRRGEFACSLLLARRLYPAAPSHKLGTLISHLKLPSAARHHRAMADAEMAAHLWLRIVQDVERDSGIADAPHELLRRLQKVPKAKITSWLEGERHRLER